MEAGKQYTAQDSTGRKVTFQWNDPSPPTDRDMDEIFKKAIGGPLPQQGTPAGQWPAISRQMQPIQDAFAQAWETAGVAHEAFRGGDVPAGIGGSGNALLQALSALTVVPVTGALRSLPGGVGQPIAGGIENVLGALPNLISFLGRQGGKALIAAGVPPGTNLTGMSDAANRQFQELLPNVAAAVAVPSIIEGTGLASRAIAKAGVERATTKGLSGLERFIPAPTAARAAGIARKWPEKLNVAAGYIADEARTRHSQSGQIFEGGMRNAVGQKIHPAEQTLDLGLDAEKRLYEKMTAPVNDIADQIINTSDAVEKTLASIPENIDQFHPEVRAAAEKSLQAYRQDTSPVVLNKEITKLNVDERAFRRADGATQQSMLRADPSLAVQVELTKNLRAALFDKLQEAGYTNIADMRRDYGVLSEVNDAQAGNLQKNLNKDNRSVFSGYNGPLRRGFWAGALSRLAGISTPIAAAVDIGVTAEEAFRGMRNKPSAVAQRAVENLGRSSLSGRQLQYVPPVAGSVPLRASPQIPSSPSPGAPFIPSEVRSAPAAPIPAPTASATPMPRGDPHILSNMPDELSAKVKLQAEQMKYEADAGFATKGGIGREENPMTGQHTGAVVARWGSTSTYPSWYGELGRNKADVLKNLDAIIKDNPTNKLALRLIDKIVQVSHDGYTNEHGMIPPDPEFQSLYEKYMGGSMRGVGDVYSGRSDMPESPQTIIPEHLRHLVRYGGEETSGYRFRVKGGPADGFDFTIPRSDFSQASLFRKISQLQRAAGSK